MKKIIQTLICSMLLLPAWVQAQYGGSGQMRYGRTVTISQPVDHDLYVAGGNININAPVHGDLVVAGGTIVINDTVTSDILLAGGEITFNGYVGDDIRSAGGRLRIAKSVAGDVVVTGGTVRVDPGATIGALIVSGGEATVDGIVTGPLKSASGKLVLNGTAQSSILCRGGNITINGQVRGPARLAASDELVIGSNAVFNEDVRYWSDGDPVNFGQSLKGGQAIEDPALQFDRNRWYFLGFATVLGVLWYLGMAFLFIMLIQYLFTNSMQRAGEQAFRLPLRSFGFGVLFWIGTPIVIALAFLTVIGLPVGVILLITYVILFLLVTVITSVVAANWWNSLRTGTWSYWRLVFVAFAIFIVLKILSLIPVLGWIIMAVLACIAFGAILLTIRWRRHPERISNF